MTGDPTYADSIEVRAGRTVFVSGQVPTDPDGTAPPEFERQCRNVWNRIVDVLGRHGMTTRDLVKVTTFLRDRSDRDENSRIRQEILEGHLPALTVVVTGLYEADWLVEIEAVAVG